MRSSRTISAGLPIMSALALAALAACTVEQSAEAPTQPAPPPVVELAPPDDPAESPKNFVPNPDGATETTEAPAPAPAVEPVQTGTVQ